MFTRKPSFDRSLVTGPKSTGVSPLPVESRRSVLARLLGRVCLSTASTLAFTALYCWLRGGFTWFGYVDSLFWAGMILLAATLLPAGSPLVKAFTGLAVWVVALLLPAFTR